MPEHLRQALLNPNDDPMLYQEAMSWQEPVQSLEALLGQVEQAREDSVGQFRLDVVSTDPSERYWQGMPEYYSTPWGPMTIQEMVEHSRIGPVLGRVLDIPKLQGIVDKPKIWIDNNLWVDKSTGSEVREGPMCVVARRVHSGDPTHLGCLTYCKGTITKGKDSLNRGEVRFQCGDADCPGQCKEAYDQLTLRAWFAKQCQLHMRKTKDELEFLTFLARKPASLAQIWMADKAKQQEEERRAKKAQAQADLERSGALLRGGLTAVGHTPVGSTPGSFRTPATGQSGSQLHSKGVKRSAQLDKGQTKLQFTPSSASEASAAPSTAGGSQTPASVATAGPQPKKKKAKKKKGNKSDQGNKDKE